MSARTKETTGWNQAGASDDLHSGIHTVSGSRHVRKETNPDLVEIIEADDPRHRSNQGQRTVLNRAERRARGRVNGKAISHSPRHVKATTHPLNSLVLAAKRNAEQLAEAKAAHPAHAPATTIEGIAA